MNPVLWVTKDRNKTVPHRILLPYAECYTLGTCWASAYPPMRSRRTDTADYLTKGIGFRIALAVRFPR